MCIQTYRTYPGTQSLIESWCSTTIVKLYNDIALDIRLLIVRAVKPKVSSTRSNSEKDPQLS